MSCTVCYGYPNCPVCTPEADPCQECGGSGNIHEVSFDAGDTWEEVDNFDEIVETDEVLKHRGKCENCDGKG